MAVEARQCQMKPTVTRRLLEDLPTHGRRGKLHELYLIRINRAGERLPCHWATLACKLQTKALWPGRTLIKMAYRNCISTVDQRAYISLECNIKWEEKDKSRNTKACIALRMFYRPQKLMIERPLPERSIHDHCWMRHNSDISRGNCSHVNVLYRKLKATAGVHFFCISGSFSSLFRKEISKFLTWKCSNLHDRRYLVTFLTTYTISSLSDTNAGFVTRSIFCPRINIKCCFSSVYYIWIFTNSMFTLM